MKHSTTLSTCALLLLGLPAIGSDLELEERALLVPVGLTPDSYAGSSVALDGDLLAIGAPGNELLGQPSGAVYVFERQGARWVQAGVFIGSRTGAGDHFGWAVALEGQRLVVGAPWKSLGGAQRGEAYVFELENGLWFERARLLAAGGDAQDLFGSSITLSGDRVVVGAPGAHAFRGSAYVFELQGGAWVEVQELGPTNDDANQLFGESVDLDGGALAVGSPWTNLTTPDPTDRPGAVFVFGHDGSAFAPEQTLVIPPGGPFYFEPDWLGNSVAIEGDVLVAGSPRSGPSWGLGYVFERSGGTWSLATPLLSALDGVGYLGYSVDVSGDLIALGAPLRETEGASGFVGAVALWQRSPDGWTERRLLVPRLGVGPSSMGDAIALDGDRLVAGARFDDSAVADGGAVHFFDELHAPGETFCFGDGSGVACPCGQDNRTPGAAGCPTSQLWAGVCAGVGSTSVADDDLIVAGAQLPPGKPALLFHGTAAVNGGDGAPFGAGLRCVGGATVRVSVKSAGPDGALSWSGLAGSEGFALGDSALFQIWFRDPAQPCGGGFNLTNAFRLVWS